MNLVIKFDHSAVATTRRERPNSASTRCAVFGVVGVLGVLALILSAVSPDDDDIQQEFALVSKTRQCVVRNWKSIPSGRVTFVNLVHYAIVLQRLPSVRCSAIERALICDAETATTAIHNRACGRSPPNKSS